MKSIVKITLFMILIFVSALPISAQGQQQTIHGTVSDKDGEPLIGVTIIVKNQPGLGTVTDIEGKFTIKAGPYEILEVKYMGYEKQDVPVAAGNFKVVLVETTQQLDELVVSAAGVVQRKATLSGAIATVDVKSIKTPTANISNALVGNVAGIIGVQTTGEPGENNTEFWVRGISTFGANDKALILVDGIERSLNELNVEDIESFSVLKDASATAIYGSRGANGVVLITTKRGTAGKVNINFKAEYGYNTRSKTPEYADGSTYAQMANEALTTRYQYPLYSRQDLEIIERGLDADLFPNVDWQNVILKDGAPNYRATVSLSGGGSTARYYVSGSYYNEDGMYKTKDVNNYSTNVSYERYNYRSNVDMDITKTTLLKVGVSGFVINQTKPRMSSDDIWGSLSNLTPLTVPRIYSNGLIPTFGGDDKMNPEVQLNNTGYITRWESKAETNVTLEQSLKFITPGLRLLGTFSFDTYNWNEIKREKNPELWRAERLRASDGSLVMVREREASLMKQSGESDGNRRYYSEAQLDYNTLIGNDHRVTALLMYFQQDRIATIKDISDVKKSIPYRNVALSGRATYGFRDRYLIDFNFGYTGSENFERGERFGFFPAVSGAWVISEEPIVQRNLPWVNMFKIRYSYGEVGNDQIGDDRFPYMSFIDTSNSYKWGEHGSNEIQGYRITTMGSPNLTWEKSKKHNLGTDIVLFNNKLSLTLDVFRDHRSDIFMQRSYMPYSTGLQDLRPWANLGEMISEGIDGVGSYSSKLGEVDFTLRGNFVYAKTEVVSRDEADNALSYQMEKGYRLNQTRGLIALGLFKDQSDIDNSPEQTFGSYLPGDIKYKDVNGDGVINNEDVVPIGYTTVPSLIYGAGFSLSWKGFDFNVLFQGAGKSDFFLGGASVFPFKDGATGNLLQNVTNPTDRWISREISGTADTENPNATLPRLSYGGSTGSENNFKQSTFWLRDGSYLRLKNLEFGYTVPKKWLKRFFAESLRVGFIGHNLLAFSSFDWWDPEIGTNDYEANDKKYYYKDGAKYPISRTYSFNLSVTF